MIQQQFLEDFGAPLPGYVAPATSEETGDGVPPEMVHPAFKAELPHQGVDPGEAGESEGPAAEPGLGFEAAGADEVAFAVG